MQPNQEGRLRRPAPVLQNGIPASPRSWPNRLLACVVSCERFEAAGTHRTCLWELARPHIAWGNAGPACKVGSIMLGGGAGCVRREAWRVVTYMCACQPIAAI